MSEALTNERKGYLKSQGKVTGLRDGRQNDTVQSHWILEPKQGWYLEERPQRKTAQESNGKPAKLPTCLESPLLVSPYVTHAHDWHNPTPTPNKLRSVQYDSSYS